MASTSIGRPAGTPSRMPTSAWPCDSPAVRKRNINTADCTRSFFTLRRARGSPRASRAAFIGALDSGSERAGTCTRWRRRPGVRRPDRRCVSLQIASSRTVVVAVSIPARIVELILVRILNLILGPWISRRYGLSGSDCCRARLRSRRSSGPPDVLRFSTWRTRRSNVSWTTGSPAPGRASKPRALPVPHRREAAARRPARSLERQPAFTSVGYLPDESMSAESSDRQGAATC